MHSLARPSTSSIVRTFTASKNRRSRPASVAADFLVFVVALILPRPARTKTVIVEKKVPEYIVTPQAQPQPQPAGKNRLLIKIVNASGPAGYYFRPNVKGAPDDVVAILRIKAEKRSPQQRSKVNDPRHWPAAPGQQQKPCESAGQAPYGSVCSAGSDWRTTAAR